MAAADGEPQLHFLLAFPVAHKKGTIWREKVRSLKNIYGNELPGPDRLWVRRGREGESGGRGGCRGFASGCQVGERHRSPAWHGGSVWL